MAPAANFAKILLFVVLASSACAITDCTTISVPGAYVLENSITDTAALLCINISVSNVALNGAGFSIDGVGTASGAYGIYAYNNSATLNNITVGNVTVTEFSEGILFNSVQNSSVLNCTLAFNVRDGVWLNSSGYNSLSNNTIYNNSIYGAYILHSQGVALRNNTLYHQNGTNDAAIYGDEAGGIVIYGSYFYDNDMGAYIRNSTSVSIGNSSFLRHVKEAMRMINVSGGNISDNFANESMEQSIQFSDSTGTGAHDFYVSGNRFYGSQGYTDGGVSMYNQSSNITLANNVIMGSTWGALRISDSVGITAVDNTLTGSQEGLMVYMNTVNRSMCNHLIENNTGYGGNPIFYSNSTATVSGGEYSEIEICGADNSVIDGVVINGDPAFRSGFIFVAMSENVSVTNAVFNNTSEGLTVFYNSSGFYAENITAYNSAYCGASFTKTNNATIRNLFASGSGFVGGGPFESETGGGYYGIIIKSASNVTIENAVFTNNSKSNAWPYSEITLDAFSGYPTSSDNLFRNITIYNSTYYLVHNETGVSNRLENFSICGGSPSSPCVEWNTIGLDSLAVQFNSSIFLADEVFVSLNSSDSSADPFNSSANITLAADCSAGVLHSIYRKENFSSSAADIVANGTLYVPMRMECSNDYITFGVTSFSGYALEDGTLNLTFLPSNVVLPHVQTTASCDASDSSVMLELYRDGELVANGTSHIEDVQNLSAGTYVYICNTTNSSASSVTDTLIVRAANEGGSTSPLSMDLDGEEVVGSTLTITVRDGSTPVDGANVRALYRINGILNAINLGNTNSDGEVEFTPTAAGEYRVEATASGFGGGELAFIVEAAETPQEGVGEPETGNTMPGTGCGSGCPAGYGCINVQCVRIGEPSAEGNQTESSPILPVVASPAWEGGVEQAEREVSSGPVQGANPSDGKGEPINPLLILVPLAVAAVLALLSRRGKRA